MRQNWMAWGLAAVLAMAPLGFAAASGTPETVPRFDFQNFDAIDVQAGIQVEVFSGDCKVELVQSPKPELLDIRQSGSTVIFGFKPLAWSTAFGPTKFKVWVPRLRSVALSGGAGAQFFRTMGGDLSLDFSGGSRASGAFEGDRLDVRLSGGAVLDFQGSAKSAYVSSSGGAQFHGRGFSADQADVRVSGGAGAQLRILQNAQLEASGGATLEYSGRPSIRQNVSGGATVRSVGD